MPKPSGMMNDLDGRVDTAAPTFPDDLHGVWAGCAELPVMSWRSDLHGQREWLSEAWGIFTGRALRMAGGGAEWTDCMHEEDRERCAGIFRVCVASGTPFTMDYRLRRMDGTYRWVMDSGVPQHLDGALVAYHGTCVDVHARRVSGDRLAERTRMLRLHERRRESELAALAHEMQRPAGLVGQARRLLSQPPTEESIETLSALLKQTQDELARAIAEIESLAGKGPNTVPGLCMVSVPVVEVMNLASRFLDSAMTHSGHRLGIDMPEPATLLCADAVQLGHAIAIVVEQVCDSSELPVKVGVTIRHHENALFLRIRRSGDANEPDFVPRAFELSRKKAGAVASAHGERPGLGTKLDFARRIVELHGGDLIANPPAATLPAEWVMRVPLRR